MTVDVKICGLRTPEAALVAAEAGASYLGFILAPSKRQITVAQVAEIKAALQKHLETLPPFVAVVVNPSTDDVATIVESGAFDRIQLSGDESPEILDRIEIPVWKALRAVPGETVETVRTRIENWNGVEAILLDTYHPGSYGGSGVTGDWDLAARISEVSPIWLAGGLTLENVASAIASVRPFGVDLSSGVETNGVKDPAKIVAFVEAVRSGSLDVDRSTQQ